MVKRFVFVALTLACAAPLQAQSHTVVQQRPSDAIPVGSEGLVNPVKIHQVIPEYTAWATRRGIEGDVYIEAVVNVDGTVSQPKLIQSIGSDELDAAAMEAILEWRFLPGQKDGKPVPVIAVFTIIYRLDAEIATRTESAWFKDELPINLLIAHRHFTGNRSSTLTLSDSSISFEEVEDPEHSFVVGVDEVTRLADERGTDMSLHFSRDTASGDTISFSITVADRVRLITYIRAHCPNAVLSIH